MTTILILLLVILVLCAVFVTTSKNILNAVIIFMTYSTVMSVVWSILQSPDLAITEAAVGAGISSVLFFIALKKIDAIKEDKSKSSDSDITDKAVKVQTINTEVIEEIIEDSKVVIELPTDEESINLENDIPAFLKDKLDTDTDLDDEEPAFLEPVDEKKEVKEIISIEEEINKDKEDEQLEEIAMAVLADMKKKPTKRRRR